MEKEKRINGAVGHKIKMKVERKEFKRKVGERTLGSGNTFVAPPGALEIESVQELLSGDKGAQNESKDVSIFIVCLVAFILHSYFNI